MVLLDVELYLLFPIVDSGLAFRPGTQRISKLAQPKYGFKLPAESSKSLE